MYAMLVGKLPFRSPRQGTKKRQKLLEQISAGITEHHEKEMEHLSKSAVNLICHLLQPNSSRRASLDDVMHHPWTTKDGAHQLIPYEYTPPDPITQNLVIELMQKVLGETPSQIKETVKRDRCDWLAAIYNLLMDQPEGRNVLQRMITADPIDKLVSSSDYQTTAEHLSLSQGYGHSHHSQEHNDATGILNKPSFSIKHHRSKDDDQQAHSRAEYDILSKAPDRRKHPTVDHKPLGLLRNVHSALYQSSSSNHTHHAGGRRLNNDLSPHHHVDMGGVTKRHTSHHHDEFYMGMGGLEPPPRPHSRMSAPEPLPIPFQKSMLNKSLYNYAPSSNEQSPSGSPPPTILTPDNIHQENSPQTGKGLAPTITTSSSRRRSAGNLKPLMKKTLSASVDTHLEQGGGGGATPWKGKK
ncbi:PREDICTED: uncharacterized protein LOC105315894 [Amphimedon queenslandica]|uniref:Protein kinase domain-containing protein n=1 Tax=Amphimedon queenslandica TaxID=400682 RepID=A0A1X7SRD1_AMPQE|nr:PREDICTED: uncharacterized protein LOC105315894 [Amphimedon queenslandica]|eukprot:XP_011408965.2 PREDICTED: uncharacterized protein LOC105315894 [Amphimedon queenslandica]